MAAEIDGNDPIQSDADVAMTSSDASASMRHQLEAIRQTLREHELPRARARDETGPVAPAAAPLQKVA